MMRSLLLAGLVAVSGCDYVERLSGPEEAGRDGAPVVTADAASPAQPASTERFAFLYKAVGDEEQSLGGMQMILPPGNVGPGRTFAFDNGAVVEATLLQAIDIALPIGGTPLNEVLGVTQTALENGGSPKVYILSIQSETQPDGASGFCGASGSAKALLVRQPESDADKSVTLAFLSAAPEEPSVQFCRRLVYLPL